MNILRIIGSMEPTSGGPCQGIRNSIPELTKIGLKNEVASLDAEDAAFLGQDPFPIHALGPARGPWAYSKKLLPWLIENLPNHDVVIIHGLWLYHGYAVHKALGAIRKAHPSTRLPRCYIMPHGMLDPYFQRDASRRLKAARNWVYWKLIERQVINEADGVLFTCEEEMRLARETFKGYRPRQQLNIGYGVAEPPAATPAMASAIATACPALGDQPYLLFLSRIHPKKGVDLLIRAYADLAKPCSQLSTLNSQPPFPSLVIGGPLDSAYAREMQQLAAELLPPSAPNSSTLHSQLSTLNPQLPTIHFPGMLSGDAKWGAFHNCDAFILPSHQENFGIAVVEALACGKPVLISKQVNIWREIIDSGAGWAEENTQAGTRNLLDRWTGSQSPEGRPTSAMARKCYEDHYSVEGASLGLRTAIMS